MNTKKKIIGSILILGSFFNPLSAQENKFKIAYINSQELLASMPNREEITKQIQGEAKKLEDQLKEMTQEYQAKVEEFQTKESLFSEALKKSKIKDIQSLEARIKEFQEDAQKDLQEIERKTLEPIIEKSKEAITKVAKQNGFSHVFDANVLLYVDAEFDILNLVQKELGWTANANNKSNIENKKSVAPKK